MDTTYPSIRPQEPEVTQLDIEKVNQRALAATAVMWTVILILCSLLPVSFKIAVGTEPVPVPKGKIARGVKVPQSAYVPVRHRMAHVFLFVTTTLLYLSLSRTRAGQAWAIAAAVGLGVGIELAQYTVFKNNVFEWWDVRDDLIGTVLASAGYTLGLRYRAMRSIRRLAGVPGN